MESTRRHRNPVADVVCLAIGHHIVSMITMNAMDRATGQLKAQKEEPICMKCGLNLDEIKNYKRPNKKRGVKQ